MSQQTYNRTQTVNLTEASINGEDLRPLLVAFNVYEDIFAHFMTCDITIIEDQSLTEKLPILGGEVLSIAFQTQTGTKVEFPTISKTFICTGITNLEVAPTAMGQKGRMYTIKGITMPGYQNLQKRLTRPYKNMKEDEIVNDIAINILGVNSLQTEPCKRQRTIVMPNIRPTEAISLLSQSAIRAGTDKIANYIFYENRDQFNFVPLDYLIEQGKVQTVTSRVARHVDNQQYALLNAESLSNSKNFDLIENVMAGMYGHTAYSVNINEKKYDNEEYIYTSEVSKQADIDGGNSPLMLDAPTFAKQTISVHPREDLVETYSKKRHEWDSLRRKLFQQFKNNKYIVETDGDTKLKVGDVVQFDLPSYDSTGDSDKQTSQELDEFLSGNYLIIHLRHYVTRFEHRMILTLAKNKLKS